MTIDAVNHKIFNITKPDYNQVNNGEFEFTIWLNFHDVRRADAMFLSPSDFVDDVTHG
jgi:hypothetical protein